MKRSFERFQILSSLKGNQEIFNYPKKRQDATKGARIIKVSLRDFSRLWSKEGTK